MSTLSPTAALRWVVRKTYMPGYGAMTMRDSKVLQQGYRDVDTGRIVWLDVPVQEDAAMERE